MRIRIRWAGHALEGALDDTPTAQKLLEALPCSSTANTWGEEVYFEVPVAAELEAAPKCVVAPGTICFWVQGSSVALPYGPTPVSEGKECRLVTAVNVLGRLDGDARLLASVRPGDPIIVERADA
ncbi:MAG: hypothetical protein JXR94_09780 [Candidatus Hydrogenedentes bacterium]|nr:hypothetical protein [Candidatus Hydrogenedentota bacterium]